MKLKRTALILGIALGVGGMAWGGCGILTAPVSVPKAIGENSFFTLSGPIVDSHGKALDNVTLTQERVHRLWEPMLGSTQSKEEKKVRVFNAAYDVLERGHSLEMVFSKEGYQDVKLSLKSGENVVTSEAGDWPIGQKLPVVMFRSDEADVPLRWAREDVDYSLYPQQKTIDLSAGKSFAAVTRNVEADKLPPGVLYATLTKQAPKPLSGRGDIDPAELNLPGELVLHMSPPVVGGAFGFVRIAPQIGFPPMLAADQAPESGYQPEFAISRARLKEMRSAGPRNLMTSYEYFYYKCGDTYGKACIRWTQMVAKDSPTQPAVLTIKLWSANKTGERNLTTHAALMPFLN